jgi:hypothetical protein
MTPLNPDDIHRTALLAMHDGSQPTLEAALTAHAATGIVICADAVTCHDGHGQAAVLTAIATAVRAFGDVTVLAAAPDTVIASGLAAGQTLASAVRQHGAQLAPAADTSWVDRPWPILLLGHSTPLPSLLAGIRTAARPVLRATWAGWVATVRASASPANSTTGPRCVLAPIAAAAVAVSEAFGSIRAAPGSDAGYREVLLNLWSPTTDSADLGPTLVHSPASWWLVGLGHLGQAFTWVISWLAYHAPQDIELVLQDVDRTSPANHSTGVLTPPESSGTRKTRLIADALSRARLDTRIIERRLGPDLRITDSESHVALIGVDNIPTRRLTSAIGWRLAIDVGLGYGPQNFASMHIRRFPGAQRSDQITPWKTNREQITVPPTAAFTDLQERHDPCGVIELAGKAVGASFVGVTAACLAIAESARELHGGTGLDILTFDMLTLDSHGASAAEPADVISHPLSMA